MQNLAHSASFESLNKDAPSKAGTKHLIAGPLRPGYLGFSVDDTRQHHGQRTGIAMIAAGLVQASTLSVLYDRQRSTPSPDSDSAIAIAAMRS